MRASVSYALAAGVSVETLTTTNQAGVGAIDLTGNEFDNRIEGNDGANVLTGNGGHRPLDRLGGTDTLNGGTGNDQLDGGAGIDSGDVQRRPQFHRYAGGLDRDICGRQRRVAECRDCGCGFGAAQFAGWFDRLCGIQAAFNCCARMATSFVWRLRPMTGSCELFGQRAACACAAQCRDQRELPTGGTAGITVVRRQSVDHITTGGRQRHARRRRRHRHPGRRRGQRQLLRRCRRHGCRSQRRRLRHRLCAAQLHAEAGAEVEMLGRSNNFATTAINLTGNELANMSPAMRARTRSTAAGGVRTRSGAATATTAITSTCRRHRLRECGRRQRHRLCPGELRARPGPEIEVLARSTISRRRRST